MIDWALFETVFSDAHLIDLDFSEWDRFVRIIVESDHSEWRSGRPPIYSVDFTRVTMFMCDYIHPFVEIEDPEKHCQWHIHDFKRQLTERGRMEVRLISTGPAPDLQLRCEDIIFKELDHEVLDDLFGDWDKPYRSLVRTSMERLYDKFGGDAPVADGE